MDSKTREILKEARSVLSCDFANRTGLQGFLVAAKIDALLTAEPEPCEDAKDLSRAILIKYRTRTDYDVTEAAREIDAYASQVADKRAEELRKALTRMTIAYSPGHHTTGDSEYRHALDVLASTEPKP